MSLVRHGIVDPVIRRATGDDLLTCAAVWRATEDPAAPPPAGPHGLHRHELETGTLLVATSAGRVVGFGASITRAGRWFLADLFVHPDHHGDGIGTGLIDGLLAVDRPGEARATMASSDHRAISLYTRLGMTPRWPCFYLSRPAGGSGHPPTGTGTGADRVAALRDTDPAGLTAVAAAAGYHLDPVDVAYWQATTDARCLMAVGRTGLPVGVAVVRMRTPFLADDPTALSIGPLVAPDPADLVDVVEAVVAGTVGMAPDRSMRIHVPGPGPLLGVLLDAGFRIEDHDLYCASSPDLLDPTRVCPSHDLH